MKNYLVIALSALLCLVSCEYDDTELREAIADHENRIAKLELLCDQMNSNLSSMETIVKSLQEKDYVTSVTPVRLEGKIIGYTISFSKSGDVTIYHGKDGQNGQNGQNGQDGQDGKDGQDGQDGHSPKIGMKQDADGEYYWTLDDEWMVVDGKKLKVVGEDGKTPLLKIEEEYWYISYDEGKSWTKLDKAKGADGDSFFKDVTVTAEEVTFILANGEKLVLPRKSDQLDIELDYMEHAITPNHTTEIRYRVLGAESAILSVLAQDGWKAEVVPSSGLEGKILVTSPYSLTEENITLFVSDGVSRTIMRKIKFEDSVIRPVQEGFELTSEAGTFEFSVEANVNYTLKVIQADQQWLTQEQTKSVLTHVHTFSYTELPKGKRWAYLKCFIDDKEVFSIKVNQESSIPDVRSIDEMSDWGSGAYYQEFQLEGYLYRDATHEQNYIFTDPTGQVTLESESFINYNEWRHEMDKGNVFTFTTQIEELNEPAKFLITAMNSEKEPPICTIEDFIKKADPHHNYFLKGSVTRISKTSNFYGIGLSDGTGTIVATFPANWAQWEDQIKVGGTILLAGPYHYYEATGSHQIANCTILSCTGGTDPTPDVPSEGVIFSESFATSLGQFTVEDVLKPSELVEGIWKHSSLYQCVIGTGYTGGDFGSKCASESNLISPEIDLTAENHVYMQFEQAGSYFYDPHQAVSLSVIKDGVEMDLPLDRSELTGLNFKPVHVDLTSYVGGKIRIKFSYKSTPENCGTWEIKNFSILRGIYVDPDKPEPPTVPAGTKVVLKTNSKDMTFVPEIDEFYGQGFSAVQDGVKIGYYKGPAITEPIPPKEDHIRVYKYSTLSISLLNPGRIKYIKILTHSNYVGRFSIESGNLTVINEYIYWTGSLASEFLAEMTERQIRIQEMTIVYE